jgi:hypothetical protein
MCKAQGTHSARSRRAKPGWRGTAILSRGRRRAPGNTGRCG